MMRCSVASLSFIATLFLAFDAVLSYSPSSGRRTWLNQIACTATAAAVVVVLDPSDASAGIISNKICAYGQGEGCDDLAEGNPYIRQLQERSAANKEAIQLESRNAYYMKNYPDWFAAVGKTMVKKPDGTFMVLTDAELQVLKNEGKIGLEIPKTMGGRVVDTTQKRILILKE